MRIHCLENVEKSLNFLIDQRVHLENMGAHDIVDGNQRLTLGLIWTIILRFQIQDITMDEVDSVSETRQVIMIFFFIVALHWFKFSYVLWRTSTDGPY